MCLMQPTDCVPSMFLIFISTCGCLHPCISSMNMYCIYSNHAVSMSAQHISVCVPALTSPCRYARHVERYHQGSSEDSEARNHVPRGLPGGGSDHEETAPRQAGAALRRCVRGTHLHYHGVYEPRYYAE